MSAHQLLLRDKDTNIQRKVVIIAFQGNGAQNNNVTLRHLLNVLELQEGLQIIYPEKCRIEILGNKYEWVSDQMQQCKYFIVCLNSTLCCYINENKTKRMNFCDPMLEVTSMLFRELTKKLQVGNGDFHVYRTRLDSELPSYSSLQQRFPQLFYKDIHEFDLQDLDLRTCESNGFPKHRQLASLIEILNRNQDINGSGSVSVWWISGDDDNRNTSSEM